MFCKICGDEENLSKPVRFWSPDDGWTIGRLCRYCFDHYSKVKPKESDYAYDQRGEYVSDTDSAIDVLYG